MNEINSITYSIIIPHRNCPKLLQRCVDSIPERDDIQIIIVDDNSDVDKKPSLRRDGLEIVLLDAVNSKGAGRARNVGLEKAKGRWLLFADADDFYADGFITVLDEYKDSCLDILYFNVRSVYSNTLENAKRADGIRSSIENILNNNATLDLLKYKQHTPWNKMYSSNMVKKHNLLFEEVIQGNDCMFSYMAGFFSKKIVVIPDDLYTYTYTQESITTSKFTRESLVCSLKNQAKQRAFLKYVGHVDWSYSWMKFYAWMLKRQGLTMTFRMLFLNLRLLNIIARERNKYVKFAKTH